MLSKTLFRKRFVNEGVVAKFLHDLYEYFGTQGSTQPVFFARKICRKNSDFFRLLSLKKSCLLSRSCQVLNDVYKHFRDPASYTTDFSPPLFLLCFLQASLARLRLPVPSKKYAWRGVRQEVIQFCVVFQYSNMFGCVQDSVLQYSNILEQFKWNHVDVK